jgi:uncharacterized protein
VLKNPDPGFAELRKALPPGILEAYVRAVSELDAIRFVPRAAPIPLLMQFAKFEQYFDRASADRYAAAATEPKKVVWYDAAHDLNDPQCLRDRYRWLVDYAGLKPGLSP